MTPHVLTDKSIEMSIRRRWLETARATALVVVITVAWCVVQNRLTREHWQVPLFTASDALGMLAGAKAAAEGNFPLVLPKFNPYLGAPHQANWNDWPSVEEPLIIASGWFARLFGLFAGVNLMVLLGQILAGLSFYLVCRHLRYRWPWAFAAALAFALSHYAFQRGMPHLTLTYYWHIPLCLLVVWWCGSRKGLNFGGHRFWGAVAVAAITSVQSAYYTNVLLQFLGLAAFAQLLRWNNWKKVAAPIAVGTVAVLGFIVMNLDTIYHQRVHGTNPEPAYRSYRNLEMYALKPLDLLIPPPTHRSSVARAFAHRYLHDETYKTAIPGEPFSPYAGIVGIAALTSLGIASVRRVAVLPRFPLPIHASQIIWLLLYCAVGGLNGLFGQIGVTAFRCTNRYSIVILALALFWAVRGLTRATRNWRSAAVTLGAFALLPLVLWDQLPPRVPDSALARANALVDADRAFTHELERALPARAMVFQLPVMKFPESWPIQQMGDYEHFRPYLHSSDLHFSYGTNKGRGENDWQEEMERKPPAEMARALERAGFAAIYINRKGFADNGAALVAGLRASGYDRVIESPANDLVCVLLTPSETPQLPDRSPQFASGWYGQEADASGETWRCSSGNAEILLHNDSAEEQTVQVSFQLSSHSSRTVKIRADGQLVYESPVLTPEKLSHFFTLRLKPGATKLAFETQAPVTFPGNPDTRALGFVLHNFRATPERTEP